eukprot:XP_022266877.1 uncharacterized protein LOC106557897 isoform X4 [Canis lupus familiaris]
MPGVGGDHRRGAREPPPADALRGRGPRCAGSWESEFGAAAALRAGRGTARATDLRWLNEAAPDAPRSSRQERTPVRKGRNRLRLAPGAEAAAGERRRAGRAPRRSACGPADGFLSKPIFRGVRASQLCDSFLRCGLSLSAVDSSVVMQCSALLSTRRAMVRDRSKRDIAAGG